METYWRVHTPNLLKEICINPQLGPAATALAIFAKILFALADRARELNDEELNSICLRLTLFSQSDPQSADYNEKALKLIQKYDKSLLKRLG